MPYWCHYCNHERTLCPPGAESKGGCAVVESAAAEYRAEVALTGKRVSFGSVPGGSTKTAGLMDHTRKFDKDMHAYREARRIGLQPDKVSADAVRNLERQAEVVERVTAIHGEEAVPNG